MKTMPPLLILVAALFFSQAARAEGIPGSEILNNFGGACRSKGVWTTAALGDATALMNSINSVLSDPDCVGISGALSSLSQLTSSLTVLTQNDTQNQIAKLSGQEVALLSQLAQTTDPATSTNLGTALSIVETRRSSLFSSLPSSQLMPESISANRYASVISTANSALTQVVSNQRCLQKNPQVLSSALALTGSIGATIATVNPMLGIGLAAGADFVGTVTEAVRKLGIASRLRKLAVGSTVYMAYQCALETLSNRWCQIDDAQNFLDFNVEFRTKPIKDGGYASAIRLANREIPAILNWLQVVRAGNDPSTVADASTKNNVYSDDAAVREADAYGKGVFAQNQAIYDKQGDDLGRWSVIQNVINQVLPNSGSYDINPSGKDVRILYRVKSAAFAPYFLLGLAKVPQNLTLKSDIPWGNFNPISNPEEWPGGVYVPSYKIVSAQYGKWITLIRAQVDEEISQFIQPDPLRILTSARDPGTNPWKISAYTAIETIIAFLTNNPSPQAEYDELYKSTLIQLENMKSDLDGRSANPADSLKDLGLQVDLQYGTILFQARLEILVRFSLVEYLKKAPPDERNIAAQLLAADQFSDVLSTINGTDNLLDQKQEMKTAKGITENNLQGFGDVFARGLKKELKFLKKSEEEALDLEGPSSVDDPKSVSNDFRQMRVSLCYGIAAIPVWPSKVSHALCESLIANPGLPGGPVAPELNQAFFDLPPRARVCSMRDFSRSSKLYQDWGIKIPVARR